MTNKDVIDVRDDLLVKGPCAIVAYARRKNGSRPAKDFIENLEKSDQATLTRSFIQMANVGKINNIEKFRKLRGRIFEFKSFHRARVLCFQIGKTWLLTHGFNKKTDKTPPGQIERAEEIMG